MQINPMLLVFASALLVATGGLAACKTDEPGVKSSYRSQWTTVAANTSKATDTAKDVLDDLNLNHVQSSATALDGYVSGYTADQTKVSINVRKVTDSTSEVAVHVGSMGDPALGKDILSRIQRELGG